MSVNPANNRHSVFPVQERDGAVDDPTLSRWFVRIWSELSISPTSAADFDSVPALIRTYNESIDSLRKMRVEALEFLAAVCRAHVTTGPGAQRQDRLTKAASKRLRQLRKHLSISEVIVSPSLRAELMKETVADAFDQLHWHLQDASGQIVTDLHRSLQHLADRNVVGMIEFPVESACRFRFFETALEETSVTTSVKTSRRGRMDRTTTTHHGTISGVHTGNTHQLACVTRHPLPQYTSFIPNRVQRLLDEIPPWIQPEVEIVDGDLFRADTERTPIQPENWTEQSWTETERPPEVVPPKRAPARRPRSTPSATELDRRVETRIDYLYDPAVTLGSYTLAAWHSDDAARERQEIAQAARQHDEALDAQRKEHMDQCWAILRQAGLLQLITLGLHLLGLFLGSNLHVLAWLTSLVLLYPVPSALKQFALANDIRIDLPYYIQANVSIGCGVLALQTGLLAITYGSLPAMAVCVLLFIAFFGFGHVLARQNQ